LILAVDIGTSATKAVLFDTDANQVAIVRKYYPLLAPSKGWSEQEPDVIFNAVLEALREIIQSLPTGGCIQGLAFSSQLYSVLAVDFEGNPLTNSLTWSDTRSSEFSSSISQHPEAAGIYQRTGCPIDAIYPLSKIQWLKEIHQGICYLQANRLPPGRLVDSICDGSIRYQEASLGRNSALTPVDHPGQSIGIGAPQARYYGLGSRGRRAN
jgi:glycerol kinase